MIDPMHPFSLFDCQHRHLGSVVPDREDGSWYSGPFDPLPAFASVAPLLHEWMDSVNQQLFTHVDELDARIAQLGLRLVSDRGEVLPGVESIQIGAGRLSFRLEKTHSSNSFNGTARAASTATYPAAS